MASRGLKAGKAFIEFSLSDKKFRKQLKALQRRLTAVGSAMQRIGRSALAGGVAIAGTFVLPIKAASDLEETMNKFNVVFGGSAGEVKAWGDNFAGTVGRSKKQIADMLASAQDLFVPLGFTPTRATELSKQISGLSLDLASFNNMADADTMRDLQAALTGSGEVMKKYGVVLSEAAVKQELLNQGLDPKVATNQQKVQARLNLIMAGTTAAQGDAIRSSGSFANQLKGLAGSASDLAAEIGGAILPLVTQLVSHTRNAVSATTAWVTSNKGLVAAVAGVGAGLAFLGTTLVSGGIAATVMATALGGIMTVAAALTSPIVLVASSLAGLVTWFATSSETGRAMTTNLANSFGWVKEIAVESFGAIATALSRGDIAAAGAVLWATLKVLWLEGTADIRSIWQLAWAGMLSVLLTGLGSIERGWSHTTEFMGTFFDATVGGVKKAWNTTIAFFKTTWLRFKGLFGGDVQGEIDRINSELAIANKGIDVGVANRAAERNAKGNANREKSRKLQEGAVASVGSNKNTALEEARKNLEEQRKVLGAKRKAALAEGKAEAKKGPAAVAAKAATAGTAAGVTAISGSSAKSSGTFSGLAAAFGGVGIQEKQLVELKNIVKAVKSGGGIPVS